MIHIKNWIPDFFFFLINDKEEEEKNVKIIFNQKNYKKKTHYCKMKFVIFYYFFFFSVCNFLSSAINLFQLAQNLQPIIKKNNLDYLQDLPRFLETQTKESQMKLLTKFLIEDEDILKDNNGVFDETGRDGIDASEDNYPIGSEENNNQKARSAATLWIKQNDKYSKYEAYGSSVNDEKIDGWIVETVLLMNSIGDHILKKVCLSKDEGLISFVLNMEEKCQEKIKFAEEFNEKGKSYFPERRKGFGGF